MDFKYLPKLCRKSTCCDTNAIRPKACKEGYRAVLLSSDTPATGSDVNSPLGTMASSSSRVPKPLEPRMNLASRKHGDSCRNDLREVGDSESSKAVIGVLDVFIHRAKELKDICVYHKQDVYAKIYLTDDPETAVATQTVNGGGKSPVFDENLQLNVHSFESTLRCEIWMFSRIRNYLQDQSLGFILVPLSDVINQNGKLQKKLTLSSNEMFHSPCGYIYLAITYTGTVPEVVEIAQAYPSSVVSTERHSLREEMERIEIPDPYLAEENQMMVAEYNANLKSDTIIDADAPAPETSGARSDVPEVPRVQTPPSSTSMDGSPSLTVVPNSPDTCNTCGASDQDVIPPEEETKDVGEALGSANQDADIANPLSSLNVELDQNVVQEQDFAEMYMTSMQEFNQALENIKLPLDSTTGSSKKSGSSSRVFYGSRAFF